MLILFARSRMHAVLMLRLEWSPEWPLLLSTRMFRSSNWLWSPHQLRWNDRSPKLIVLIQVAVFSSRIQWNRPDFVEGRLRIKPRLWSRVVYSVVRLRLAYNVQVADVSISARRSLRRRLAMRWRMGTIRPWSQWAPEQVGNGIERSRWAWWLLIRLALTLA